MTWFLCTVLPDLDDAVIVTDPWMDRVFLAGVDTFEDGSRGWSQGEISDKPYRFCWTKLERPPEELWK